MKISIAMATYNGAAYLREQLASFASQTRLPDELIVTDDASTDATCDIVREFAATAPFPVRFEINPANLGYARNFGKALALTTGDLVFLSDQDDVWFDTKIARVAELADAHPNAACLLNDALLADEMLVPSGVTKQQNIRAYGLPEFAFVMGCCSALRRGLLDLVLPIPAATPSHDNWIVGIADCLGLTRRFTDPLQFYRLHGRNSSKFFVNEAERPGLRTRIGGHASRFASRFLSDRGMAEEYELNHSILMRLIDRRVQCEAIAGVVRANAATAALENRVAVLKERRRIRALPRLIRPSAIWSLWLRGGYRGAGRLPGALKDVVLAVRKPNC